MRVVIDARFYGIVHTGIGRYVENLIKYLPGKAILIVSQSDYFRPELAGFVRVVSHTHPYSVLSQFEIPWILFKLKPDLVHIPYSSIPILWPGKIIVTFHDLIKHVSRGPDTTTQNTVFYWIKYLSYLLTDLISARRASKIITPTKYWQNIIGKKYHLPVSKIAVTYEAVDNSFFSALPKNIPNLKKPFLVHTGNLYPHKNISLVFNSLHNLPINLYLICARSVFSDRAKVLIRQLNLENKVQFLGRLSDQEVKFVYSQALALIFPSKVEGFGLNGLEAMSVGLPVISSNASCLPEVYGNSALYFDPDSSLDFENKVLKLLNTPNLRKTLITSGYKQVKKYSWAKMAKETWAIYQSVSP